MFKRERFCGVRHEKDFCRGGDNPSVCTVARARSRTHRRRSVRCVVGSSRFGTYWRGGRCSGRLHGGSLYCSLMGTEEIIRDPSRRTICKIVRERCFQSRSVYAEGWHSRSSGGSFGVTRETFDTISRRPERDAASSGIGMTPGGK